MTTSADRHGERAVPGSAEESAKALEEALAAERALAEIIQIIGRSSGDLDAVLEAICAASPPSRRRPSPKR